MFRKCWKQKSVFGVIKTYFDKDFKTWKKKPNMWTWSKMLVLQVQKEEGGTREGGGVAELFH